MKTITEQFPPLALDYLVARINDFELSSLDAKHQFISELIQAHVIFNINFSSTFVFKRARKIDGDYYPESIQDFLWKIDGNAMAGRVNPEGFPVLYVADRAETAYREINIDSNIALLVELQIREGLACRVAPIGEIMLIQRGHGRFLKGKEAADFDAMLNACNPNHAKALLITDAFLFEQLTQDRDEYRISSYIAKSFFEKLPHLSAIAYPSVQHEGAVNIAIKTNHFWNSWSVVAARRQMVDHLACGYYETSQTEHVSGITRSGKVQWAKGEIDNLHSHRLSPPWHPS
ncbi:RES domain-containing protein [Pantoea agglomerans]|uniref:RES domain-containing protein n=1 Tax=Enterobacter agglomerans TaxID=549 RepID=UPI00320ABAF1